MIRQTKVKVGAEPYADSRSIRSSSTLASVRVAPVLEHAAGSDELSDTREAQATRCQLAILSQSEMLRALGRTRCCETGLFPARRRRREKI